MRIRETKDAQITLLKQAGERLLIVCKNCVLCVFSWTIAKK